jgi:hypothetical protein
MRRRYLWLLVASLGLAVALSVWGDSARKRAPAVGASDSVRVRPVEVTLMIGPDWAMTPASVSVEKGQTVAVTVTNAGHAPARLELPGYEDRVAAVTIDPGVTWRVQFVADRPGDDFAWTVNGEPAGRLLVTGSHLVEGHR